MCFFRHRLTEHLLQPDLRPQRTLTGDRFAEHLQPPAERNCGESGEEGVDDT